MKPRQFPKQSTEQKAAIRFLAAPLMCLKTFLGEKGQREFNVTMHGFNVQLIQQPKEEGLKRFHD